MIRERRIFQNDFCRGRFMVRAEVVNLGCLGCLRTGLLGADSDVKPDGIPILLSDSSFDLTMPLNQ